MKIENLYKIFLEHRAISTDSRNIQQNSLFFALKGANFNGNKFAVEAIEKGAAYSIIDEKEYATHSHCILVDDVLNSLQELANYRRKQLRIPIVGITGSNGKTTTKELLYAVLNSTFKTYATKGNLNNHIGVPLSLLAIDDSHEMAIIEMGANHIGEIDQLSRIAEPDFGLITNIGKAHLEGFGSYEGVKKAKTELYRFIQEKGGVLFVNSDNEIIMNEAQKIHCEKHYYGSTNEAEIDAKIISSSPYLSITIATKKEEIKVNSKLAGAYNRENLLAAACAGNFFNIPLSTIGKAIESYEPGNSRSQLLQTSSNLLLCDYYNANPSSMEAALRNFSQEKFRYDKKIVLLGEMKELGQESTFEHEKIINLVESMKFDLVFFCGNEFIQACNDKFICFPTSEEMGAYLKNNVIKDAVVLIKGSRGSKMELVVPFL